MVLLAGAEAISTSTPPDGHGSNSRLERGRWRRASRTAVTATPWPELRDLPKHGRADGDQSLCPVRERPTGTAGAVSVGIPGRDGPPLCAVHRWPRAIPTRPRRPIGARPNWSRRPRRTGRSPTRTPGTSWRGRRSTRAPRCCSCRWRRPGARRAGRPLCVSAWARRRARPGPARPGRYVGPPRCWPSGTPLFGLSAGVRLADIDLFDFYSCFPIAVFNVRDGLGLLFRTTRVRSP